jgi:predicted amidohydrolase YtcJ
LPLAPGRPHEVCNSLAFEARGDTRETPDPPGGVIVRGGGGEPTGVLKDAAMDAISKVRAAEDGGRADRGPSRGDEARAKYGVTSVQDLPGGSLDIEAWRSFAGPGR